MAEVAYAPSLNGASFRRSAELSASWNGSLRGSRERGEAQSRRQRSKHREAGAGAGHEQQQGYASTSVHAKGPRKPPVPLNGVDDALLPPADADALHWVRWAAALALLCAQLVCCFSFIEVRTGGPLPFTCMPVRQST